MAQPHKASHSTKANKVEEHKSVDVYARTPLFQAANVADALEMIGVYFTEGEETAEGVYEFEADGHRFTVAIEPTGTPRSGETFEQYQARMMHGERS
jgi:hypothetical protein